MNLSIFNSKPTKETLKILIAIDFIGKVSIFVPLVLLVLATNYYFDPASLFKPDEYIKGISDILLEGKNVANVPDFNDRLMQKFYINGLGEKKDVIVLGSSRSLQINSSVYPEKDLFNNAVTASTLEDYIGIYEIYRERGISPGEVVIGVDPWIFNKSHGVQTWKTLDVYAYRLLRETGKNKERYNVFMDKIDELRFRIYRLFQVFSISYFQASFREMAQYLKDPKAGSTRIAYFPTESYDLDVSIKARDGSYLYDRKVRSLSNDEVVQTIKAGIITGNYYNHSFSVMDDRVVSEFEAFLDYLVKNNVKVLIWLAPYHPYLYDHFRLNEKYNMVLSIEAYIRDIASKNNIEVIGSYDPNKLKLHPEDFYDGIHPKRSAVTEIFRSRIVGRTN